jgi:1,6-anhydro-N-acetylmuramate kinase
MMRRVVGCMTGTSLDGVDAALVEIEGSGLAMKPRLIRGHSADLGPARDALRRLADQVPLSAGEIAAAMRDLSVVHAGVIRELLQREHCDLICVHGQTVYHKPPLSWQLLQPAPIAREFQAPVVFDLRSMDIAAGGQGAPVTPIADRVIWGASGAAIVNLGGFCNITVLPIASSDAPPYSAVEMSRIRALDVCPCNHLLDAIARKLWGVPYDDGGARALKGNPHHEALEDLEGIFASQAGRQKSLGTGDESLEWLSRWRNHTDPADLAATACEAIAAAISLAAGKATAFHLAGGGARNAGLVRALAGHRTELVEVLPSDLATYREAMSFAILGALCQDRIPITLPRVTGCPDPAPISGAWILP